MTKTLRLHTGLSEGSSVPGWVPFYVEKEEDEEKSETDENSGRKLGEGKNFSIKTYNSSRETKSSTNGNSGILYNVHLKRQIWLYWAKIRVFRVFRGCRVILIERAYITIQPIHQYFTRFYNWIPVRVIGWQGPNFLQKLNPF